MKEVTIYTDGACSGNPGPGGWAAILKYGEHEKEIYGHYDDTTNIRMELTAVRQALRAIRKPCRVTIHTDLQLIVDALNKKWIYTWFDNRWKTSKGDPVKNADLWLEILQEFPKLGYGVTVVKVKGHSGDPLNERCDELAKKAASGA